MKGKVFCIGMNKTGTTSLHTLFRQMGLRSYHGMYSDVVNLRDAGHPLFAEYDCFSDGEMHDYAFLDASFPAAKFILTTRRLDHWLASRIRHVHERRRLGKTGWMRKEYERDPAAAVRNWITRRRDYHRGVLEYFRDRPDRFLVINVCDADAADARPVARVAEFIGVPAPTIASLPWANRSRAPHADGGPQESPSPEEQVRRAFSDLNLPEDARTSEI